MYGTWENANGLHEYSISLYLSLSLGSLFPMSYSLTHLILRGKYATFYCIVNLLILALNRCLIGNNNGENHIKP